MNTAQQDPSLILARHYRVMLEAMARPGNVLALSEPAAAPAPLTGGLAALCLALVDLDTPLWLDPAADAACRQWLRFHCGCPLVETPISAAFACVLDPSAMPPLGSFNQGEPEYPDRSATLFIEVESLAEGTRVRLEGPGIDGRQDLNVRGLPQDFWDQWSRNTQSYPLGVDVYFVSGRRIAGLPRSVRAEVL